MPEVELQPHDTRSVTESVPGEAAGRPQTARQPSRELLTAWLLLLLNQRAVHGYELLRQLKAQGVVSEPGSMYRTLRKLEGDGCTASCWENSAAGPRRRLYQLTAKGRRELGELVATITVTRDGHAAFLRAYDGVHE